jgi:hypothetical protein
MKSALVCFHKNLKRYPKEWILLYKNSIINQTYKNFDIFELNYGGDDVRIFEGSNFISLPLKDHAQAHNYLLNMCFYLGYDIVFNTNIDDIYPSDRIKIQIQNFDPSFAIISGNYVSFTESSPGIHSTKFDSLKIEEEFSKNHNIIVHPACAYSRKFLEYDEFLISEEIPSDDFQMWKRMLKKGAKFKILPDILLYYRISDLKTKTEIINENTTNI